MKPQRYATIMDGPVIRWRFDGPHDGEINASRNGISICGAWPIMKLARVSDVIATLEDAVKIHGRLSNGDEISEIPSAHMFDKDK